MFENILYQGAASDIALGLKNQTLPNALLFWGEKNSAKLTAALELARVLSCSGGTPDSPRGQWDCACPSCGQHKVLASQSLLLAGNRYCQPEIAAARKTLLEAQAAQAPHLQAARFLFIRGARKLTARFSPALWERAQDAAQIAGLTSSIEESLEEIRPGRDLPPPEKLQKLTASVLETCGKLESGDFMYTDLPVDHVRAIASWARLTTEQGKKTVVIENAEKMSGAARNGLLKILEEPPEDTVFVLTTANRQALMATILSRVRTYRFDSRTRDQQQDLLRRVFHTPEDFPSISAYLDSFLPVNPPAVSGLGADFLEGILAGRIPNAKELCAQAKDFKPPLLWAAFFEGLRDVLKRRVKAAQGAQEQREIEFAALCGAEIAKTQARVSLYRQNPASALEGLENNLRERAVTAGVVERH